MEKGEVDVFMADPRDEEQHESLDSRQTQRWDLQDEEKEGQNEVQLKFLRVAQSNPFDIFLKVNIEFFVDFSLMYCMFHR